MLKKKEACEINGGRGKTFLLQLSFFYAHTKNHAEDEAHHQWRMNACSKDELADLYKPEHCNERL